jgi:tRNA U54 and U55 pseudouridine synthase Pus10
VWWQLHQRHTSRLITICYSMHVMPCVQALCWCSRPLTDTDVQALVSVKDLDVSQDTPVRVLHRRAPKVGYGLVCSV